jgi:hypothetical protein
MRRANWASRSHLPFGKKASTNRRCYDTRQGFGKFSRPAAAARLLAAFPNLGKSESETPSAMECASFQKFFVGCKLAAVAGRINARHNFSARRNASLII